MKDVLKRARAILASATSTSAEEEFAYFVAHLEIEQGTYSEGLMKKAFALAGQHGEAEHAKYLELRAAQLMGDAHEYLKRLRVEWTERIKQEEMLDRERMLAQQKAEFDRYKLELGTQYGAVELEKRKASIENKLTPLLVTSQKSDDNNLLWMMCHLTGAFLLLMGFLQRSANINYQPVMIFAIGLIVLGLIPFGLHLKYKSKQDEKTMHRLKNQLSEVESKFKQYESKLKAHRGYYE